MEWICRLLSEFDQLFRVETSIDIRPMDIELTIPCGKLQPRIKLKY